MSARTDFQDLADLAEIGNTTAQAALNHIDELRGALVAWAESSDSRNDHESLLDVIPDDNWRLSVVREEGLSFVQENPTPPAPREEGKQQ